MRELCLALLVMIALPTMLFCATAHDLRSTIIVDGSVTDFADDDWVLTPETPFPELPDDSRWGTDNDVRGMAVTWDDFQLYVAVPAVTRSTTLMLFIDTACDGASDMSDMLAFRRNIDFGGTTPNFMLEVNRLRDVPRAGFLDCNNPLNMIGPDRYASVYRQDGTESGALEVAIPWELLGAFTADTAGTHVPQAEMTIELLAAVTGGASMGAGDAAPDPSVVLEADSTRIAILNNYVTLPLDSDGDGILDIGISTRDIAEYAIPFTTDSRQVLPMAVSIREKLVAPGTGTPLSFLVSLDPPAYDLPVFVSARIFSVEGRLVRDLYEDEPRDLSSNAAPVWDIWDGRDESGSLVPGGIYVLAVSGGPGRNAAKNTVRSSFAVVR